jgi:WD40 repeat protein
MDQIIAISVNPEDENAIATCGEDNTVRIWDFVKYQLILAQTLVRKVLSKHIIKRSTTE